MEDIFTKLNFNSLFHDAPEFYELISAASKRSDVVIMPRHSAESYPVCCIFSPDADYTNDPERNFFFTGMLKVPMSFQDAVIPVQLIMRADGGMEVTPILVEV